MVKKRLYQILVLIIFFLVIGVNQSYGVSDTLNEKIASWHSDFTSSESTDKKMKQWKSDILNKLKTTFNYKRNTINEMMAMKTKIYITNDPEKNSTCKIRIRRKRSKRIKWKIRKRRIKRKLGLGWKIYLLGYMDYCFCFL